MFSFPFSGSVSPLSLANLRCNARRQQDEELDLLSDGMERIGGTGLTRHDELNSQVRDLDFYFSWRKCIRYTLMLATTHLGGAAFSCI